VGRYLRYGVYTQLYTQLICDYWQDFARTANVGILFTLLRSRF